MRKIKAVLSDFDGTLVDENDRYSVGIKKYIKKIIGKNIRFSLATGRSYYSTSLQETEKELGIKGIHILHGGGMIYDSIKDRVLWEQDISEESKKTIIEYLLKHKLSFSFEAKNCVYLSQSRKNFIFYKNIPIKTIDDLNYGDKVLKIVLFARDNKLNKSDLETHILNLKNNCHDISLIEFEFHDFFGADITSEKATKHTAVLEYLKILDIEPSETIAIGDGQNDYPLFTACGFGIAMANAPKALKEIAGLVVPTTKDGGMIEALKYIDETFL